MIFRIKQVPEILHQIYFIGARSATIVMLGLEIGRVANFKMVQDEQAVIVEMRIDKGIKIYDDALAAIKTEGLIGDRYMDIAPGGVGELLKPGGTITETQSPTDLSELIGKYAFGDVKK